ncbi:MAG: epimerase, partial [bacterium]|nr:epimerase [Candidatus Kapabacteria bacterium]
NTHEKLRELVCADMLDLSSIESELVGYDACLFCLGISSQGMSEAEYKRITYDIAMSAANTLVKHNPDMTFEFISGAGSDSTEKGKLMWARIKGMTENALLALPFKSVYVIRPAYIQPLGGIVAREKWIRWVYAVFGPLYPLLKRLFPQYVTSTEQLGRAMIRIARDGAPKHVLGSRDINAIAA